MAQSRGAASLRSILLVTAPALALLVFAVGLRIGARADARAAQVFGGEAVADRLVARVLTVREESGVRETESRAVRLTAAAPGGPETVWTGRTNDDGVAEVVLAMPPGGAREIRVRVEDEQTHRVLAEGPMTVPPARRVEGGGEPTWLRPTSTEGEVHVDVALPGERISTLVPTPVWAHVRRADGAPAGGATLEARSEEGLRVLAPVAVTCANGWAPVFVVAEHHLVGLRLRAKANGAQGQWLGPLPVAAGAPAVVLERERIAVVAPPVARRAYALVGEGRARRFAAALDLEANGNADATASFPFPALADGVVWVAAGAAPEAAEQAAPSSFATPVIIEGGVPMLAFRPTDFAVTPSPAACAAAETLASAERPRFDVALRLDGFATKAHADERRRRDGLVLAMSGLAVGAFLEVVLVVLGARESRASLARLAGELEAGELEAGAAVEPAGGVALLRVVAALLLAVLGFLLFAALAGSFA